MIDRLQKTCIEILTRAEEISMKSVAKLICKELVRTCKKQLLELKF